MESEWLVVLSAEARLAWVQLLCYVKAHGHGGRVKAKPVLVFARQNFIGEEAAEQMLRAAKMNGALREEDGAWVVQNWHRHQGDETNAERQQRWREKRRGEPKNEDVTGVTRYETLEEKRREENIYPPYSPPLGDEKTGFKKPALEEVLGYADEIQLSRERAEAFFDHFTSNGWKVSGKAPMKDWKAALRNWKRSTFPAKNNPPLKVVEGVRQRSREEIRRLVQ
jgi:hypothetical protein